MKSMIQIHQFFVLAYNIYMMEGVLTDNILNAFKNIEQYFRIWYLPLQNF